ncbi:MAG TPA: hypothetical protein VHC86_03490 [Opitutaceae bacterium]|nr:hypothetical protein [Opitutaceae bacterium]
MNPRNGFGFLLLGVVMLACPALAPAYFPAPAWGGEDAQAMWLQGMGVIQILFGGAVVLRHFAIPALRRWGAARRAAAASPAFALSRLRGLPRL